MSRQYNDKISDRANRCLDRREAVVRGQKRVLALVLVAIVLVGFLVGGGIKVFANNEHQEEVFTYYKSICIEEGDTLWDIAGEYTDGSSDSRLEYIDEICRMNNICADELHVGDYIIISYLSADME